MTEQMTAGQEQTSNPADGKSELNGGLAANYECAIGGVFRVGNRLAACTEHGCGNKCYLGSECEHKQTANAKVEADGAAFCAGRASNDGLEVGG